MRSISRAFCLILVLFFVALLDAECRYLQTHTSPSYGLVSDGGVDDGDVGVLQPQNNYTYLQQQQHLKDQEEVVVVVDGGGGKSHGGKYCKQMYGFLPCSNNIVGHLFLILVYEYLLFHGESYLAAGGEQIFKILGPGVFGASAFDILGALPESLILLVTGLSSDKESAQEYASTGVGLLAGSSILLLTVVWGTCVIIGKQKLKEEPDSDATYSSSGGIRESLTGYGISMDVETRKMARLTVLSVTPLIIMQIPNLFPNSSKLRNVTLMVALTVAVIFLISYFIYQIFKPQIEKIRLEYIKHDDLILRILQRVEKQTLQKILAEDGTPNVTAISGLYHEISQHGPGKDLSASEVKDLLLKNKFTDTNIKEEQIAEMLKIFDRNGDQIITKEEFVTGLTEYINQTKHALDRQYLPKESLNKVYQTFIKPWIEHVRKERELKGHLISEVLRHVQNDVVGKMLNDDGTADTAAIRRLFEEMDSNRDNHVSRSELERIVKDIHFSRVVDAEDAVTKLVQELDINRDNEISEKEFVDGFTKWINSNSSKSPPSPHGIHQTWEEVEKVMEQDQSKGISAWLEAIGYVVLGITMLSLLAEPLIASVQNFSEEAGISSFFISFIIVPIATNFREATSAIKEASHKKSTNTSQTMYEIYGAVFMNNILGFVVISILIYVRDIAWEFSADVLVVAIVCAVMGLTASFRPTFPVWTSIPAYLLYLISLLLVFVLKDVLHYV